MLRSLATGNGREEKEGLVKQVSSLTKKMLTVGPSRVL